MYYHRWSIRFNYKEFIADEESQFWGGITTAILRNLTVLSCLEKKLLAVQKCIHFSTNSVVQHFVTVGAFKGLII